MQPHPISLKQERYFAVGQLEDLSATLKSTSEGALIYGSKRRRGERKKDPKEYQKFAEYVCGLSLKTVQFLVLRLDRVVNS